MSVPVNDSQGAATGDPVAILYANVRALVAATWPEVVQSGRKILETDQADMLPWEQLPQPSAVIEIANVDAAADWYKSGSIYAPIVSIDFLGEALGPLAKHRHYMRLIRRALNKVDRSLINIIEMIGQTNGRDIPANAILTEANKTTRVARFQFRCLIGESFDAE